MTTETQTVERRAIHVGCGMDVYLGYSGKFRVWRCPIHEVVPAKEVRDVGPAVQHSDNPIPPCPTCLGPRYQPTDAYNWHRASGLPRCVGCDAIIPRNCTCENRTFRGQVKE